METSRRGFRPWLAESSPSTWAAPQSPWCRLSCRRSGRRSRWQCRRQPRSSSASSQSSGWRAPSPTPWPSREKEILHLSTGIQTAKIHTEVRRVSYLTLDVEVEPPPLAAVLQHHGFVGLLCHKERGRLQSRELEPVHTKINYRIDIIWKQTLILNNCKLDLLEIIVQVVKVEQEVSHRAPQSGEEGAEAEPCRELHEEDAHTLVKLFVLEAWIRRLLFWQHF